MATGPEHYKEAERLIAAARRGRDNKGLIDKHLALRKAMVHATLAHAAAVALQIPGGEDAGMVIADAEQWEAVASAQHSAPPAPSDTDRKDPTR